MNREYWKQKLNGFVHDVVRYVYVHKTKAVASVAIVFMLSGTASAGSYYYQENLVDIYDVYLYGEKIGTVSSPEVVDDWFRSQERTEEKRLGFELQLDKDISYQHRKVFNGEVDDARLLELLKETIQVKAKAYKMTVDGEVIGYVKDQATAEAILESVKSYYAEGSTGVKDNRVMVASLGEADFGTNKVKSVSFKEEVEIKPAIIDPEEMNSEEEIKNLLLKGTTEEQTYTVQEGDCLGCIADRFGLTLAEIKRLNPGIDENTLLQIGQKLVVTANKPKITVQTLEETKEIKEIPFETEVVEDKNLYRGQTTVQREGSPGKKEITYSVVKENGVVVSRDVIAETVLSEPITRIVRKGVKKIPAVSSGVFRFPVIGGKITSKYGWRWGRMHKGIDITGSRTVMAADGGRVVYAGRKSGYGNTIIIDHGNGYQTLYGHLSSINVRVGQQVSKGQKIGVMGSTGRSTGTHLHFEVHKNGNLINPSKLF